jgi:hypothetical protein
LRITKLLIPELAGDAQFWFHQDWTELGPIRETLWGTLISQVTQEAVDYAYRKWTRPLVGQLGLSPVECLQKVRRKHSQCHNRPTCQIGGSECHLGSLKRPWCFEPVGIEEAVSRGVASTLVEAWSQNVWVVVING